MIYTFIEINGERHQVGTLWPTDNANQAGCAFVYSAEWLINPQCFAIEQSLPLTTDVQYTKPNHRIFSGIADSSQDAWCRNIIYQRSEGKNPSGLEYLLGIHDFSRFGALRFAEDPLGPFLSEKSKYPIPPLYELQTLLSASETNLQLLLDPKTSVFRPKATVIDADGNLFLAKFSHHDDPNATMLREAVALSLATKAKLLVPKFFIQKIHNNNVLLISRFDRNGTNRIHYLSGIGMLGSKDDAQHSYLDLATIIKQYCVNPERDLRELWSRLIFTILISNFDDHLQNYGFLYQQGWSLAPLFDVIPSHNHDNRTLVTMIDREHKAASLDLALSVAAEFGLDVNTAKKISVTIAQITQQWRTIAKEFNIPTAEIEAMAPAFEHDELRKALEPN